MRETQSLISAAAVKPTLEFVRNQFEAWRKKRSRRRPIPEALWQSAMALCNEHSIFEVSQALRMNYTGLKERVLKARGMEPVVRERPGFVKLDLEVPIGSSECLVEMEAPNGARMRMSFKGGARDFDPVELGRAFWRQGQ